MPRFHGHARLLSAGLALATLFSLSAPISISGALASTNLTSGDTAVISQANGDPVRLRTKPGSSSSIIAEFSEGASVSIIDGPTKSSDGSSWYRVAVEGQVGYIAADFLWETGYDVELPGTEGPAAGPTAAPTSEGNNANDDPGGETVSVTGTASIANTNGDPVRCRASASIDGEILAVVFEGDSIDLTGDAQNGWQPVRCENRYGWISTEFISGATVATPTAGEVTDAEIELFATSGSGTIRGTNGDGVRCRSNSSTTAGVITTLGEGAKVTLRGAKSGDWIPVTCSGKNGFVWAEFVAVSSSGGGNSGGSDTGNGIIAHTDGQGVRCRQAASFDGRILGVLVEGDAVQFRGSKRGEWQPVVCGGKNGYVHADYVERGSSGGSSSGGNTGGNNGGGSGFSNGDTLKVAGTGGTGVRLRSAASSSASVITVVGEGGIVTVRSGSSGSWIAVKSQSLNGFIHQDYLKLTHADPVPVPTAAPGSGLSSGDHARVTDRINFRSAGDYSGSVIGIAEPGIVVQIKGKSTNGFYPVEWGSQSGFMHGDYLAYTTDPLTAASGGVSGNAGNGQPSATGQAMVNYAMNYIGYPYIWATAGPNSFDCSGFTYWVTKHVIGQDIGRGLWTQIVAGTPVTYGSLKPGDIVFFQNTYTWGLSHVGIYIGNNQFIHAENEETGVRISSLTSNYYSTRYYGAVRLG